MNPITRGSPVSIGTGQAGRETRRVSRRDVRGRLSALRLRLEALMAAHEASVGVLGDEPAREVLAPTLDMPEPAPDETVGMTLGRYKLRKKLGEGGCGTVYVAEQTEPVRRKVALKVIKLGMDTREVIARFEAERQALGTTALWRIGSACLGVFGRERNHLVAGLRLAFARVGQDRFEVEIPFGRLLLAGLPHFFH